MGFGPLPGAPDSSTVLRRRPVDAPHRARQRHRAARRRGRHRPARAADARLPAVLVGLAPASSSISPTPAIRAVAVDLRGYGASDKPPRGYDAPTLAADMAALVTVARRVATRWWSATMSAALLAWTMAARHPRVVRGLVVLGAAHPLRMRAELKLGAGAANGTPRRTRCAPSRSRGGRRTCCRAPTRTGCASCSTAGPGRVGAARPCLRRRRRALRARRCVSTRSSYCAAEYFRWMLRSIPRADGRRFAASLRAPIDAPVLHLHGDFDTLRAARPPRRGPGST